MHPDTPIALLEQIEHLRHAALANEHDHAAWINALPETRRRSARNLLHYLGVRAVDLRALQRDLAALGLSSLGLLEPHVLASLDAVSARLCDMIARPHPQPDQSPCDFDSGPTLLRNHARALLGPPREDRDVRIMVTLPSEAADDPDLLTELLRAGMDIARINCAHDDAAVWLRMVQQVRTTAAAQGRDCLIELDLAGPKSRTGTLPEQGRVLHLRPRRDARGMPIAPALLAVWFGAEAPPVLAADGDAPRLRAQVDKPGLSAQLPADTSLDFTDSRGRKRSAVLHSREGDLLVFSLERTAYIEEGTPFRLRGDGRNLHHGVLAGAPVVEGELRLRRGDPLILLRHPGLGDPGERNAVGDFVRPPRLHCTLQAAFDCARPGQTVGLDDGRIGATITVVEPDRILLHITHAADEGSRLRAEKGINFPETTFDTAALTTKDRADLAALIGHVDLVALSFLRQPDDVTALRAALAALGQPERGIVLKIENRQAFAHLPAILLEGLQHPRLGIMVARGDLAVELGFERLSEVQEEILWLCEAAHLPVIWATQILDSMARSGLPSRPEVTDAAMSIRAECAMLNKGPHIVEAVRFLGAVLGRMEGHYAKRMMLRRALSVAMLRAAPSEVSQPAVPRSAD